MASLVTDRGRYYAQFFSDHRRPRRKKVPLEVRRKRDAFVALRRVEGAVAAGLFDPWTHSWDPVRGRGVDPAAGPDAGTSLTTVGEAARSYLAATAHLRPSTVATYAQIVRAFASHVGEGTSLSDLTAAHIERWLNSTSANDVTRRKYAHHVGYLCRHLVRRGALADDLSKGVRLRRVPEQSPRAMTDEMVAALVETARSWRHTAESKGTRGFDYGWLADLVEANVDMGLRRGELVALRPDHVDLDGGALVVRNGDGFETKSGRERVVPLSTRARAVLAARLAVARERVFESAKGPLSPHGLTAAFRRVRRRAGLPEWVNLHSTRHTALTRLADRGVPIDVIRQVAGHSSVVVTERYTRLRPDAVRDHVLRALG